MKVEEVPILGKVFGKNFESFFEFQLWLINLKVVAVVAVVAAAPTFFEF